MSENKIYAGFWVRFFAGTLDTVFLAFPSVIFFFIFGLDNYQLTTFQNGYSSYSSFKALASSNNSLTDFIFYAINVAYIVYFLSNKHQATIGKRLLGIYVGNCDGSKLSVEKAICRALASMITVMTLGIGFLLVIFTKEKTALHDLICKTRVFHGKK